MSLIVEDLCFKTLDISFWREHRDHDNIHEITLGYFYWLTVIDKICFIYSLERLTVYYFIISFMLLVFL